MHSNYQRPPLCIEPQIDLCISIVSPCATKRGTAAILSRDYTTPTYRFRSKKKKKKIKKERKKKEMKRKRKRETKEREREGYEFSRSKFLHDQDSSEMKVHLQ